MKRCTKCGETKSHTDFSMKDGSYRKSQCRKCEAERRKGKINPSRKQRTAKVVETVIAYKEVHPCVDCGLVYPYFVMDFDHLGEKRKNISKMASQGYSLATVMAEIQRCELVCSNCHRFRTHERRVSPRQMIA